MFTRAIFSALFLLLTTAFSGPGVSRYYSVKTGTVHIESNAPLEIIKAYSHGLKGLISPVDRSFTFVIDNKSFQGFNSDLQKSHFHENYMETHSYPRSTFTGKIIEELDFTKDGTYEVRGKGKLVVHGVAQERIIKVSVDIKNGEISLNSKFRIPLKDHNISIPKVVNQKIAEEVDLNISAVCIKK